MKILSHIDGIKMVRGLAGGVAWVVIIAIGMILGSVIAVQAAPAVPEFADYQVDKGKGRWNFVKIGDVQKDGKTPIVRFEF